MKANSRNHLTNAAVSCKIIFAASVTKCGGFAAIAHLVERHLAKVEVASSSLVGRSTSIKYFLATKKMQQKMYRIP